MVLHGGHHVGGTLGLAPDDPVRAHDRDPQPSLRPETMRECLDLGVVRGVFFDKRGEGGLSKTRLAQEVLAQASLEIGGDRYINREVDRRPQDDQQADQESEPPQWQVDALHGAEKRYPTPRTVSTWEAAFPSLSRSRRMWVSTVRVSMSGA